jgi:hypothetical protein
VVEEVALGVAPTREVLVAVAVAVVEVPQTLSKVGLAARELVAKVTAAAQAATANMSLRLVLAVAARVAAAVKAVEVLVVAAIPDIKVALAEQEETVRPVHTAGRQ